ncbi:2644_t:CDS:2 [Dentiscutata erythropus]|uniref:2644_t:CDS:1 n=1 Tax=Dentiscutata erythropus TaxID=1348616 RepID=A0A9N9AP77_9GLOM|nr:2644_t:CDS:2 [Dentiscutata erythropus]
MSSNQKAFCRKEPLSTSIMYNKTNINNIENIVENIIVNDENECMSTDHGNICDYINSDIFRMIPDIKIFSDENFDNYDFEINDHNDKFSELMSINQQTDDIIDSNDSYTRICTSLQTLINDAQSALQKKTNNDNNTYRSHSSQCLGLPSPRSRSSSRSSNVSNWLMNHYSPATSAWECGCGYCILCLAPDNISILESRPNSTRTTPITSRRNSIVSRQKYSGNSGNPGIPDIPEENFINRKQRQLSILKRLYRYQLEHKNVIQKITIYLNDDDSTPFPSSFGQNIFCNVNTVNFVNNTTKTNNNRTFYSNTYNNDNSNNNFNTTNYYNDTTNNYYSSIIEKDNKEFNVSKNFNSNRNFKSITKRFMNLLAITGILFGILQNSLLSSRRCGNLYYKRNLLGGPILLKILSQTLYAKRNSSVRSKRDMLAMIKVIKYVTVLFVGWSVGRMGS